MYVPELISPFRTTCRNRDVPRFMPYDCEFECKVSVEDTLTKHIIYSSVFPEDSNTHFKWEVMVVNYLVSPTFFLQLKEKRICDLDISVECSFFIKTEDGSTIIDKKGKKLKHGYWVLHLFCNGHELSSKLNRAPLIFGARVSARYDINPVMVERFTCENNYSCSLNDGTLSDVILRTVKDGKQFKVHRFMLTSQSKVFAAMFSNEMKEKLTGLVNIQKFSGCIMRYVLYFIYNGTVNFRRFSVALNLLEAAEYFDLKDLKDQCAIYLLKFVDTEHAWQLLLNAHLFCVEDLKAITLEFIRVHKKVLCASGDYQTFPKDLLLDINKAFSKKRGFRENERAKIDIKQPKLSDIKQPKLSDIKQPSKLKFVCNLLYKLVF